MITKRPPHLENVWIKQPVFFITCVSSYRRDILGNSAIAEIFISDWQEALQRYGWAVGEYVIMPDHVHFMCRPANGEASALIKFIGEWKRWTSIKIGKKLFGKTDQFWQPGFFDRLLRNEREWQEKRQYMLDNPIRAGLVSNSKDWPYQGDLDMFRL